MDYAHCSVGRHRIRYLRLGKGPLLLFLHGYGGSPQIYLPMLEKLAKHHTVIAPSIYGMDYLRYHPHATEEYIQLTKLFCKKLAIQKYAVVGHSFGGSVALRLAGSAERAVAINPVLPVRYGALGFTRRALWKHARAMFGVSGGAYGAGFAWRKLFPFLVTFTKHPRKKIPFLRDLSRVKYQFSQAKVPVVLFGDRDEFFDSAEAMKLPVRLRLLPGFSHDWPIFYGERAAKEVERALSKNM